jgi:prevent-host-death family protein
MSRQVNIHHAKTHLSQLLEAVENGEEIVIARAGEPIAKLSAYQAPKSRMKFMGIDRGKVKIAGDFDAALPEEILADFEA